MNVEMVKRTRKNIQLLLEDYIRDNIAVESRGRFGDMLLLLPVLQDIARRLIEQVEFVKLFGTIRLDSLLQEMLLGFC